MAKIKDLSHLEKGRDNSFRNVFSVPSRSKEQGVRSKELGSRRKEPGRKSQEQCRASHVRPGEFLFFSCFFGIAIFAFSLLLGADSTDGYMSEWA